MYCACIGSASCSGTLPLTNVTANCVKIDACATGYINCADAVYFSNTSCAGSPLTLSLQAIAAGNVSYADSLAAQRCRSSDCALKNQIMLMGGPGCNISAPGRADSACRSSVTAINITLVVGGSSWTAVRTNASFAGVVTRAATEDLSTQLNRTVSVWNLATGSLIVSAVVHDGPNPQLFAKLRAGLLTSSWLVRLRAVYASVGGNASDVIVQALDLANATVMNATNATVAPTTPATMAPTFDTFGDEDSTRVVCGNGCIAGIVFGSIAGAIIIGTLLTLCVATHKRFDNHDADEEDAAMHSLPLKRKCDHLHINALFVQRVLNRIVELREQRTLRDAYECVIFICECVRDELGKDGNEGRKLTPPPSPPPPGSPNAAGSLLGTGNTAFDPNGLRVPLALVFLERHADMVLQPATQRAASQQSYADQLVRATKSLFGLFRADELEATLRELRAIDDIEAPLDASRKAEDELLTIIYGLLQYDTQDRRERATYLGFSFREVDELREIFREEAQVHRGGPSKYVVTRERFIAAYKDVRGHAPEPLLVTKIYPTASTTHQASFITDNATTPPGDAQTRSFMYFYGRKQLSSAFKMERALKFFPFAVLFVVYISVGYGKEEGYFLSKATTEPVTLNKFPSLPSGFPASCSNTSNGCQFYASLYQSMIADIALRPDLVNWLQGPVLSRFWTTDADDATAPIDGVNVAIGALKIRQLRSVARAVPARYNRYFPNVTEYTLQQQALIPLWFAQTFDGIAAARDKIDFANTNDAKTDYGDLPNGTHPLIRAAFQYRDRSELNSSRATYRGRDSLYDNDGYALIIPFNFTGSQAKDLLTTTLGLNWIDLNTRAIVVEVMVYGRQIQAINRARFVVEMTVGGVLIPTFDSFVFPMFHRDLYPNIYYAFLALYLLFALYQVWFSVYVFFWRIPRQVKREHGIGGFKAHVRAIALYSARDLNTLMSLLNAACLVATWVLRAVWFYYDASKVGDDIVQVERWPKRLDDLAYLMQSLGYVHAANVAIVTVLTLDYLSENERLALIVNTIRHAAGQLFALAFAFIVALVAFALTAHIGFGLQIMDYQTMQRSIANTLLAVLDNYDYDAWTQANRTFAPFYLTAFHIVVVLFLLNMVITVLMDAFQEVTEQQFDAEELQLLMENDLTTAIPRPTFTSRLRSHIFYDTLFKSFGFIFLNLKRGIRALQSLCRCCGGLWVSESFDYKAAVAHLSRSNQYRFWKGTERSIAFIQSGTPFTAALGHQHMAELLLPLARGGYDVLAPPSRQNAAASAASFSGTMANATFASGDQESATTTDATGLKRKTVMSYLRSEYKDSAAVVLRLFQEIPNYHLKVPSALLLQRLAQVRHMWRLHIDDFTHGDDDDDSLTPQSACHLAARRENQMMEIALREACEKAWLILPSRRDFNYGGFYPIISEHQADVIRARFDSIVESNLQKFRQTPAAAGDNNNNTIQVPYGVTIGDLSDIFREVGIGATCGQSDDLASKTLMHPVEFRGISEPICFPDGHPREVVGVLSLESLLRLGVETHRRRKQQLLAFGWNTSAVSLFIRTALTDAPADQPFEFDAPIVSNGSIGVSFQVGYTATTGVEWTTTEAERLRSILEDITYRDFVNFATCQRGEHSQQSYFSHFARHMAAQSSRSLHFLWYIVFVIFFTAFIVTERGANQAGNLQVGLQELMETQQYVYPDVNKTDDQFIYITNIEDWKGFVKGIILPTVYAGADGTGQLPLASFPATAVGAVKIRQVRNRNYDCSDKVGDLVETDPNETPAERAYYATRIEQYFQPTCVRQYNVLGTAKGSFSRGFDATFLANASVPQEVRDAYHSRSCDDLRGSGLASTEYNSYSCSGYALVLPLNMTLQTATSNFDYLMNNDWIDQNTAAVILDVAYFQYGINVFSRWRYMLEIAVGGGMQPRTSVINYEPWISEEKSTGWFVFIAIYLLLILLQIMLFVSSFRNAYLANRSLLMGRRKSLLRVFIDDVWTGLNLVAYSLFIASWVLRAVLMTQTIDHVELYDSNAVTDRLEAMAAAHYSVNSIDAICAMLTYGRFASFFHLFPSLVLVTRTMKLAIPNMASLLLTFMIVFWCFVSVAYTIFGPVFWDFATLSRTFTALFRVLLGTGLDFDELSTVQPIYGGVFYAAFLIVCSYVMFNLIIAVLNNAFGEAREEQYNFGPFLATMEHDAHAKLFLQGTSGFGFLDIILSEVKLAFWIARYFVTYPCLDHAGRQRILHQCYRNPRYFWRAAVNTFNNDNPAHEWFRFVDESCGNKDLLIGAAGTPSRSDYVIVQSRAASPDGDGAVTDAGTLCDVLDTANAATDFTDVNDDLASSFRSMTRSSMVGLSAHARASPRVLAKQIFSASRESEPFAGEQTPQATEQCASEEARRLGEAMARTDIRQSFFNGDADQWRVQRITELLRGALAADADNAWVLVCICSEVTGFRRRQLVESLLQYLNEYQLESKVYDGRTTAQVKSVFQRIERISALMPEIAAKPFEQRATITDDVRTIVNMMRQRDHRRSAQTTEHWRVLLRKPAALPAPQPETPSGPMTSGVEAMIAGSADADAAGAAGAAPEATTLPDRAREWVEGTLDKVRAAIES
jgi:hypothetical protein